LNERGDKSVCLCIFGVCLGIENKKTFSERERERERKSGNNVTTNGRWQFNKMLE